MISPLWIGGIAAVVLLGLLSRLGEKSGTRAPRRDFGPPSPEQIDRLLLAGRKIDAIKTYRSLHGVDLKAAKDAIDARARQLGR
jgi:hypothetical protein